MQLKCTYVTQMSIGRACVIQRSTYCYYVSKVQPIGSSDLCFDFSFRRFQEGCKAVRVKAGGAMANHDVFLAPEITMANGYGAGIVKNQAFSLDHFLMVKQKKPCTYNI